jgi:hypothetical protein
MNESGLSAREMLVRWILDLLGRSAGGWNRSQWEFIGSLLDGQEGTKTLAQLAVATSHLRSSGLDPKEMGSLRPVLEAMEAFWSNPSGETYDSLHHAGKSLDPDT